MIWLIVLTLLIVLAVLTALISGLVFYLQFCASPEKRWRDQVFNFMADAERRVREERRNLKQLKPDHDAEACSLQDEAFRSHLAGVSVNELEAYPGIGPATIAKLRDAGYKNLAALVNARLQIPGVGEKRGADIENAVRDLVRQARSSFEAGACPQALELAEKLERLSSKYTCLEARVRARAAAAEEVVHRLQDPMAFARQLTLWRWVRAQSNAEFIPPEMIDAALPDLETALRDADAHATPTSQAKRRGAPPAEQVVEDVLPVVTLPAPPTRTRASGVQRAQARAAVHPAAPDQEPDMPDDTHVLLMELTIQFALGFARVDGPVTPAERRLIRQHIHRRFSYNRALLNRAEAFCAHYESAAIDSHACLARIKEHFTPAHRAALVEFAGQILAASGQTGEAATLLLRALAQRLGVPLVTPSSPGQSAHPPPAPPPRASKPPAATPTAAAPIPAAQVPPPAAPGPPRPPVVVAAATPRAAGAGPPVSPRRVVSAPTRPLAPAPPALPTREECLALLEIPPTGPLSANLVRRQWNLLSQRYSPAKVAGMGPEFVKMAEAKLATFRLAAETLLKPLGEKLETTPPAPPAHDLRHNPDLDDVFGGM